MRKTMAILLSAVIALACFAGFAEETGKIAIGTISINGVFTLKCGLPDGYGIQTLYEGREQVIALLSSEDETKPQMVLSVAFDETYADVDRMNDLDEEAFALLEKTFTDVDPTVEISYGDTGLGTRLLIARQTDGEQDYIDFLSIYKGYFVEFVMVASQHSEDKNLTDEQLRLCIDFLTDLDFVPSELPADSDTAALAGQTVLADLTDYDPETNTVQAELKRAIALDPETVAGLEEGDTLALGAFSEVIEKMAAEEDGSILINDEILLTPKGESVNAFFYEQQLTETFAVLTLEVPENLIFLDQIDPETGEILDDMTEHTAAEWIAMLTEGGYPDFASENVYITFGEDGQLTTVTRIYTPWQ